MDTLEAMRIFVAVVERNGFSAAAEALGISTAAVTRHIAALERRLSARLLNRTTRRVSTTSLGTTYYHRCVQILAEVDALEDAVNAQTVHASGLLRINAPLSYGISQLAPLLAAYQSAYPKVELELALSDRLVDIVEEGFDLAIRITQHPPAGVIARKLGQARVLLCASPGYLEQHGAPATAQDLAIHQCLSYSYRDGGDRWMLHGPQGGVEVAVNGGLRANNGELLREAAIGGMGIIAQPEFIVGNALAQGQLVQVLPHWQISPIGIYALYASRSHLAPKVRSFIDYLVATLR